MLGLSVVILSASAIVATAAMLMLGWIFGLACDDIIEDEIKNSPDWVYEDLELK